jgi:ParB family chromosome partitioning protein
MSKKRRVFDIDLPDEIEVTDAPKPEAPARRGPMASAISENAEALKARQSASDAIREENDALAHELVALREAGQVVEQIPLGDVKTTALVRDRLSTDQDMELDELVTSIREIGLSNPIRVIARPDGRFELVQGYRRLNAYRRLHSADGQGGWDRIPALVLAEAPDVGGLYRRMVDENLVRKDLSFAEMAHIAQVYAADPATDADDITDAVAALFQSAPYSKRSYIRSFAYLMDSLGDHLAHPTELPRALGLALARVIKDHPEVLAQIKEELKGWDNRSVADELEVLRRFAEVDDFEVAKPTLRKKAPRKRAGGTKTTFHIRSTAGQVKCTAAMGRLEIQVDRDFSSIERKRLEQAIASLVDGLV